MFIVKLQTENGHFDKCYTSNTYGKRDNVLKQV